MGEHIRQPLDAMDIRGKPSDDEDMLAAFQPETLTTRVKPSSSPRTFDIDKTDNTDADVHYPWFVLADGSMPPDVYWARRRRARKIGIMAGAILVAGAATAAMMFKRDGLPFPTLVSSAPPETPVAIVAANPPPVAVAPPPPVSAPAPKAEPAPPPAVELPKPPPVQVTPPPPAVSKPPAPAPVTKPPVAALTKPPVPVTPPPVEVTPQRQAALTPKPDPPRTTGERPVVKTPAPTTPPRMPRPLSQDPARLAAGVPSPSSAPPRASVEPAPAPPPNPSPSVSPPPATVDSPSAATSTAAAAPPAAAVVPPTAAAVPPARPPVTPPAPSVAPPAAASAAVVKASTTGIQNALARYRQAFSSLDTNAVRAVWPTVNQRSLSRAFEQLEQQQVTFDNCQIDVNNNERAQANCSGTARYVPRIGNRATRVDQRQWHFSLVKVKDEWFIGAVDAR